MNLNERLFNIFKDQVVGASVVLIKGKEEFKYTYGYRSLIDKKPVEDDTIFRIASISKVIISMAALKLVEDGLLDIDEDISKYLGYQIRNPKYPHIPITTKMLMLHTSSITDCNEEGSIGYDGVNGQHFFVSLEDLLTNPDSEYYSPDTYSDYTPGEKYIYSNFGPGIIACIIEKCSNQLFTEFVDNNFLKPLAMDASFKAKNIIKKDKISDAFNGFNTNRTAKQFIDATYPDFPLGNNFRGPAGGLFTSMQDLSKIMIALMNEGLYKSVRILKKETVETLFNINFFARRYYEDIQVTLNGATGGAYGISSVMYFVKEKNTGICFIANGGNYKYLGPGLNNIQEGIIDVLLNEIE